MSVLDRTLEEFDKDSVVAKYAITMAVSKSVLQKNEVGYIVGNNVGYKKDD